MTGLEAICLIASLLLAVCALAANKRTQTVLIAITILFQLVAVMSLILRLNP